MPESSPEFSYDLAFKRNIGWVTEWEQQALRFKRVAIAGMGGVGGVHLLTLVRFGIGEFHIADFDEFDIVNFNRQIGANMETVGRPKAEVLEEMARAINPSVKIRAFNRGIDEMNIEDFLDGVDVFVDGFDFFVLDIRKKVFQRCAELGIPSLCAAPIGMGVGFLCFEPRGMSFESYFRLAGHTETDQYLRFLVGLVPRALHRAYLVDGTRLDLANKQGPSTVASCQLCAGVTAVAAVKLLLRRGNVLWAPYHHHYDPYVGKLAITRLAWGNAGPLQRLKLALGARSVAALARQPPVPQDPPPRSPLEEILRAACWAPSGDNVQPWTFEILGEESVRVHLRGHAKDNVYDYRDGEPTILAGGALIESLRIAASGWGRRMEWAYEGAQDASGSHGIKIDFVPSEAMQPDPLIAHLMLRSVDRRRYRMRPLTAQEKECLQRAAGNDLKVDWHESIGSRLRLAWLGALATDIRLRAPEAYEIHRSMLDFQRNHSPDGIPSGALGLDRATILVMRWAMQKFRRLQILNRLGGTWSVAAQLDLLTGAGSAAYFTMRLAGPPAAPEERIGRLLRTGQHIQRFWLEASRLGLAMQPALAILAFAHYGETEIPFTSDAALRTKAKRLSAGFHRRLGMGPAAFIFLGRIGEPYTRLPTSRSTRRRLSELLHAPHSTAVKGPERFSE